MWQPGTLTQAVTKGQWILLEDIDHAPLDVVGSNKLKRLWSRTLECTKLSLNVILRHDVNLLFKPF